MFYTYLEHPVLGTIGIAQTGDAISHLWMDGNVSPTPSTATQAETPLLLQAKEQLAEYFAGQRQEFTLPLAPVGTVFQQKAWQVLREIPYGETISYREQALRAESPKGFRAVGGANNKNPIAIFIPCHRVIGTNGKMVGYASGLSNKEYLLALEASHR